MPRCIYCGHGDGVEYRKGFHYICTVCTNELSEFADLGKDFFKEFIVKGSISKEFIESKVQNLINWQRKWTVVNDVVEKIEKAKYHD